jgi:regulator of RNase E activity RraA
VEALDQVSDALVKLGIHHGGFLPDIKAFSGAGPVDGQQKVVGPATTVQVREHSGTRGQIFD